MDNICHHLTTSLLLVCQRNTISILQLLNNILHHLIYTTTQSRPLHGSRLFGVYRLPVQDIKKNNNHRGTKHLCEAHKRHALVVSVVDHTRNKYTPKMHVCNQTAARVGQFGVAYTCWDPHM
jgi:hypothetical protein